MAKKDKQKNNRMKWIVFVAIAVVVIILFFVFTGSGGPKYAREDIDAFAQCLSEKGAVMYGTFWCPHCAKVKKMFGESFRYVAYVECDPRGENEQSELCLEKGIENYATFEFNNNPNSWLVGEPTFEDLAAASGCVAPEKK